MHSSVGIAIIMSIFAGLKIYADKWQEKEVRNFTDEEIAEVESATVVESNFGCSVCFTMKAGGQHYIPCDMVEGNPAIGEIVDLAKAKLVTLTKRDEADILRVRI